MSDFLFAVTLIWFAIQVIDKNYICQNKTFGTTNLFLKEDIKGRKLATKKN